MAGRAWILGVVAGLAACGGGGPTSEHCGPAAACPRELVWTPVNAQVTALPPFPPPPPPLAENTAMPAFSAGGWRFEAPTPFGFLVNDVMPESSIFVDVAPGELVAGHAALLHYDGTSWTSRALPGTSPAKQLSIGGGLLFALTEDGRVLRGGTAGFNDLQAPFAATRFVAAQDQDVWAFAVSGGSILAAHWEGVAWSTSTIAPADGNVVSAWASSPTNVWVALDGPTSGYSWNGTTWTKADAAILDGSAASGNYFGLRAGSVVHNGGSGWSAPVSTGSGAWQPGLPLWADTATGSNIGFAAGRTSCAGSGTCNALLQFDGNVWNAALTAIPGITALRGAASNDVWAFGHGMSLHWNGTQWSYAGASALPAQVHIGGSAGDLWAVGNDGALLHRDATTTRWANEGRFTSMHAVAGSSANDVWAVGGAIFHFDASGWRMVELGASATSGGNSTETYADVTAAPGLVLIVNDQGRVYRGVNGAWDSVDAGAVSAWGSSPADIWIVDSAGGLVHWNGSTFGFPAANGYSRVRGAGAHDVWFAGSSGLSHWDGTAISKVLPDAVDVAATAGRVAVARTNGSVTILTNGVPTDLPPMGITRVFLDGTHVFGTDEATRIVRYDL